MQKMHKRGECYTPGIPKGRDKPNNHKRVVVGICAMGKKAQSKPMKEITSRLATFEHIKVIVFDEQMILNDDVASWPNCDCLISFYSKGFPLDKAQQYEKLRKPYIINNLEVQYDIQDRRKVYKLLEQNGIPLPRYAILDRDDPENPGVLIENEDSIEVNGVVFNKPFVEKPVNAEDHNIFIYYPTSAGGGSQRLFRKIGSRSSVYSSESRVRKNGSYIYEDFMPTDGTDVKVYTVGPDYAHAEARKSPALDGKVERDIDGKEIRFPVILNNAEKMISRQVCTVFKQQVCGFDLLRARDKSYVCDVNGFSFVKNSVKYYDDCAKIIGNWILRELASSLDIPWSAPFQLDDPPIVPTTFGQMMELRCVIAVIRHGDRTPKQKMKVEVRHPKFFEVFKKYDGFKKGHVKLKTPAQLQEILDVARTLLSDIEQFGANLEMKSKLEQLKSVLEMYGHFSGINRKVQMKYQPTGRPRGSSSEEELPNEPSLVLILKWGGELTPAGRFQAEELGGIFRCIYPGGDSDNPGQGLGVLRLHSTFRHDLKIYASDEGRVQMTAAAFTKGFLALEGELTPILAQMVKSANTNGLLDNDSDAHKYQNAAKERLHALMSVNNNFTHTDYALLNPCNAISIYQAMDFVKNPVECCAKMHVLIQELIASLKVKRDEPRPQAIYHGESWELMLRRWIKIDKDFGLKDGRFDISKIPDIYDCIKYDLQHNQHILQFARAEEMYTAAKYLADIVVPQEYGLNLEEKLAIGRGICTPLMKKICSDLESSLTESDEEPVNRLDPKYSSGVASPGRHVKTRLYFTSESHLHGLVTSFCRGGLVKDTDEQGKRALEYVSTVSELNYMSQIVIMLYEDPTKDPSSDERFHVELHFSPGVNCCVQKNLPPGPGFRPTLSGRSSDADNSPPNCCNEKLSSKESGEKDDALHDNCMQKAGALCHSNQSSDQDISKKIDSDQEYFGYPRSIDELEVAETLLILSGQNDTLSSNDVTIPEYKPQDNAAGTTPPLQMDVSAGRDVPDTRKETPSTKDNMPKSPLRVLADDIVQMSLIHAQKRASRSQSKQTNPTQPENSSQLETALPIPTQPDHSSPSSVDNIARSVPTFNISSPIPIEKSIALYLESTNKPGNISLSLQVSPEDEFNVNAYPDVKLITPGASKPPDIYLLGDSENGRKTKSGSIPPDFVYSDSAFSDTLRENSETSCEITNLPVSVVVPSNSVPIDQSALFDLASKSSPKIPLSYKTNSTKSVIFMENESVDYPCKESPTLTHSSFKQIPFHAMQEPSRHRHSVAGQQAVRQNSAYFQLHGISIGPYGGVFFHPDRHKYLRGSHGLISTAVISGSSSAPNLTNSVNCENLAGIGGVPAIRPLETLHNALSLRKLHDFLRKLTTPLSSGTPPHLPYNIPHASAASSLGSPCPSPSFFSGDGSSYSQEASFFMRDNLQKDTARALMNIDSLLQKVKLDREKEQGIATPALSDRDCEMGSLSSLPFELLDPESDQRTITTRDEPPRESILGFFKEEEIDQQMQTDEQEETHE